MERIMKLSKKVPCDIINICETICQKPENKNLPDYKIRRLIYDTFIQQARAAGLSFILEIWPYMCHVIETSSTLDAAVMKLAESCE